MDFAININDGRGEMTFDKADTIMNNIFLSLNVVKGSFFAAPEFGLRKRLRMKNTKANALLVRDDCREALQWLLDSGRAKQIEVSVERDTNDAGRLKASIEVVQADDMKFQYETFIKVV